MQCLMLLLNLHNSEKQYTNLLQTLLVFQETTNTLISAVSNHQNLFLSSLSLIINSYFSE
mgnify:FL=1